MNVFAFRSGHSVKNVNPQSVGEELERIRAVHGTLTAALVLEAAVAPENPLHQAFEWDDSAAATAHRLNQARRLIVSIRVLNGPIQSPIPAFVSVRTPDAGRNYVPSMEALSDEQLRLRVLSEIQQFAEAMQRRYANYQAAAEVIARLRANVG